MFSLMMIIVAITTVSTEVMIRKINTKIKVNISQKTRRRSIKKR